MGSATDCKRLFVGNLFPAVTEQDLLDRFAKFGTVSKVEIKTKKDIDGKVIDTFAFIDLGVSDGGLSKCISSLGNTKWKGNMVKIQQARESFMERLARERREKEAKPSTEKVVKEVNEDRIKTVAPPLRNYTEEREEFKGFGAKKSTRDTSYDPIKMFKAKLAGENVEMDTKEMESQEEEDLGTTENGCVTFANDNEENTEGILAVNKVYHSSSEEEDEKTDRKKIKKLKKAKEKGDVKKKFYSDTSESDEETQSDLRTGTAVLSNLKTFSSFWKDSDNEEEDEVVDTNTAKEVVEGIETEKVELPESKGKPRVEFEDASIFRYDPTKDDQEIFLRAEDKEDVSEVVSGRHKSFFEVREDLKSVFGAKSNAPSFSFGFRKDQPETVDHEQNFSFGFKLGQSENTHQGVEDSDEEFTRSKGEGDIATTFGLQLKGKSSSKKLPSFFFTEEDQRLESGLSFFFDKKVDLDELRTKYSEERPILAEILKKRARNNKAKRKVGNKSGPGKRKSMSWKHGSKAKKLKRS